MYTLNSKISDVLKNPIGNDILTLITEQAKIPFVAINNPLTKNIRLKTIKKLSRGAIDEDFLDMLCTLLNQPLNSSLTYDDKDDSTTRKWWKEAIAYQIYPRSFKDSNHDGIGDLGGIIEKLDYLQTLGINLLWLSPIYDSPNDDNGYDIRDYYQIMSDFGTMDDFDRLLAEAHKRGIRLIMDLVINHTSDEHHWFQESQKSEDNPYRNYYLWKKSETPPNNWESFFSGSAWNHYPETGSYALHLFSKKQMDLNWDYKPMRQDVYKMIRFWLDKGIDGFRLDVINFISKVEGLPDGTSLVGSIMGQTGAEHYFFGPHLHQHLHEMNQETFSHYDTVTVGETPGIGINMAELLTREDRQELDLIFNFDHLDMPGKTRFDDYKYDLNYLKKVYMKWQANYSTNCWNTLFYDNHDNPRMLSKIDPHGTFREPLGKLLGLLQLTLKGTPFIYQGQELGLLNGIFETIDDFRDVESINLYHSLKDDGISEIDIMKKLQASTRDHSRITIPWNDTFYHGFSDAKPWINVPLLNQETTADTEVNNKASIYHFYRQLIDFRKNNTDLIYGDIRFIAPNKKDYFAYFRTGAKRYFIEMNLSEKPINSMSLTSMHLLLSNYDENVRILKPFECRIYQVRWK